MAQLTAKAAEILERAMQLSSEERGQLIDHLAASLDDGVLDEGAEEAWAAEIKRRVDEIDSGRAKMIPLTEFRRRLATRMRNAEK
jgi:putative addiction module component (TIGR02574 family)